MDYTKDGDTDNAATGMSDTDNEKDPEATQLERLSNTHMRGTSDNEKRNAGEAKMELSAAVQHTQDRLDFRRVMRVKAVRDSQADGIPKGQEWTEE